MSGTVLPVNFIKHLRKRNNGNLTQVLSENRETHIPIHFKFVLENQHDSNAKP